MASAKEAKRLGNRRKTIAWAAPAFLFAPDVAFYTTLYPMMKKRAMGPLKNALARLRRQNSIDPRTAVYLDRTDAWEDNRVGPRFVMTRHSEEAVRNVRVKGNVNLSYMCGLFSLIVFVNDQEAGRKIFEQDGAFSLEFDLVEKAQSGSITIEIRATSWFVPHFIFKNGDFRPISWRMEKISLNEN